LKYKKKPVAAGHGDKMKTTNKSNVLQLYKLSGDFGPVELLRLSPKSGGFSCYLPRAVVEALGLSKDDHNLICFVDNTGPNNFLIITSDRYLSELLKPLILERRRRGEEMKQRLKTQLQQQSPAEEEKVSLDVY